MGKKTNSVLTLLSKKYIPMPCAPLESYEGPPDWALDSATAAPRSTIEEAEAVVLVNATSDLERAYRTTLRENGLSSGENTSLFDHMRAIGLLPQQ